MCLFLTPVNQDSVRPSKMKLNRGANLFKVTSLIDGALDETRDERLQGEDSKRQVLWG